MQPIIKINKGTGIKVWQSYDDASREGGVQLGTIATNEIFVLVEEFPGSGGIYRINFHSGSYKSGYIFWSGSDQIESAYSSAYSYGYSSTYGYIFKVRATSNLYNGLTKVGTLSPGDQIYTPSSSGGSNYTNRLYIKAFTQGGKLYPVTDGWVDTGLYEGFDKSTTIQVYGQW